MKKDFFEIARSQYNINNILQQNVANFWDTALLYLNWAPPYK